MSVTQDATGRRSVTIELEVPGTPAAVWAAIATGPGISSWFVPAQFEERDGTPVALTYTFGPGVEPRSAVTDWEPLQRYATEADGWMPGSPPIASEWSIETRDGGMCTLRIVQSLFASTDEWDNQLEAAAGGLAGFLRTLQIYLKHFSGQRSALMQVMTPVSCTEAEAWDMLTTELGLHGADVGQRIAAPAGSPALSGVVEYHTEDPYDALLWLDASLPGIAALGVMTYPGGATMVAINFYLYGDEATETVARAQPVWQSWLTERFPMAVA